MADKLAVDRDVVRELQQELGEDGVAQLVRAFLSRTPERLAILREADARGDADALREAAHALKGAALSFGATEMGGLAAELERTAVAGATGAASLLGQLEASFERSRAQLEEETNSTDDGSEQEAQAGAVRAIRVMLADDDPDVRDLLTALVAGEPSLDLVGAAADADAAIAIAAAEHPDVALLDLEMPGGGGWKAIREIRERSPATQSIVLTALDTPEEQLETMRSGAVDFLPKGASRGDIVDAIRSAVRWRPENQDASEATVPAAGDDRLAELERRVQALEQAIVRLSARVDGS